MASAVCRSATSGRADPGTVFILGIDVGASENETCWTEFLRHHQHRDQNEGRPVISDAQAGPEGTIR